MSFFVAIVCFCAANAFLLYNEIDISSIDYWVINIGFIMGTNALNDWLEERHK